MSAEMTGNDWNVPHVPRPHINASYKFKTKFVFNSDLFTFCTSCIQFYGCNYSSLLLSKFPFIKLGVHLGCRSDTTKLYF